MTITRRNRLRRNNGGNNKTRQKLTKDSTLSSRTSMSANQVRDLLAICLKTTYFLYDGVIYSQVEGAAMGSPINLIVANLFKVEIHCCVSVSVTVNKTVNVSVNVSVR